MSAKTNRDDFPPLVRRTVAERAAYLCSLPDCNHPTIGPHSDPNKSKNLGVAAHICAAAIKGPRYDENQTSEQRKSIENAIWVCAIHGTEIDKDDSPYPEPLLREWKRTHEKFIATLPALGFRKALGLRSIIQGEQQLAAQLLIFLSARGVLYTLYEFEIPRYCLESVQNIRDYLIKLRLDAHEYPELDTRFQAMIKACQMFFQEAGPLQSTELMFQPGSRIDYVRIQAALSGFRNVFGLHIQQLSELYDLKIDEDLQAIIPEMLHETADENQ